MALRNDGTLVVWGSNTLGMVSSMPTQAGFTDIHNIYNDTGIGLRDVDCNGNGVLDALDIANGFSFDCNQNGTPDECELLNPLLDLNQNGILDACEPDSGLSESHGMAYVHTSVLAGLPIVPPGLEAGVVDLRLVQGVYDVVLKDAFTYLPPAVTGVNPPAGAWYNGHTLLVETVGFNPNVSTQVAIGDSAPQPANFVDPNTLRVSVPAGTVVGAGVQPIKVTQGPLLSVLNGAWTSLPDLALLPAGSAASGGSVAIRVRAEGPGTAWVLAAGAVVATPVPLFGVHYGLVLDANVGHVIGKVSLSGAVPTATYPFGPGVLQPGTTLYVQVLVVESPLTGGTELSFTNVESVTIP